MTNVIMYKSSDTFSQIAEGDDLLCVNEVAPNLEERSYSDKKDVNNIEKIEKIFESALIHSKILYCRPNQIIGSFEVNPTFLISKYKIAIFIETSSKKTPKNQDKTWEVLRFTARDVNDNLGKCIQNIHDCIKQILKKQAHKFTFVDLFAGIGGFRIPLEELGGRCLGFSEIDKKAIETYKNNFVDVNNEDEVELGSVTNWSKLPFENIDLIVGGVPCQSWSVAGKMRGFDDPRGKLWEDTIRIVELNQPKTFIFENVKGLIDPRNKESLSLIVESFEEIGYSVKYKLLNSYDFGLPQNRERIYIVGVRNDYAVENKFQFPENEAKKSYLHEIIEGLDNKHIVYEKEQLDPTDLFGNKIPMSRNRFQKTNELNDFFVFCDTRNGHTTIHSWDMIETTEREKRICLTILRNRRKQKYGSADGNPLSIEHLRELISDISEEELRTLINKKILKFIEGKGYVFVNSKNSSGINGLYRIYLPNSNIFSTLTATGTKDVIALNGVEGKTPEEFRHNFIEGIIKTEKYRGLTARESGKLQGFPEWFAFNKDERFAKKQFGNAVSTFVVRGVAEALIGLEIYGK
ncbi:MAG: DNA cytosine methyltransferase [Emticicia sp.]|nr:DNA cytosine methyltransferase [Emticicia sp.]